MRAVRGNPRIPIVDIAGSACAAGIFVDSAFDAHDAMQAVATRRCRPKAGCADSESVFLAMKKFSRPAALRLIVSRQNRIFARIADR